jgi:hypothetical protein
MRIALSALMLAHGIAHIVGFLVPWKLVPPSPQMPYRTTILRGALDLGDAGIRAYGLLWLLLALGFAVVGGGLFFRAPWWFRGMLGMAGVSALFCLVSWPEARIGLFVNVAVAALVVVGVQLGWSPLAPRGLAP